MGVDTAAARRRAAPTTLTREREAVLIEQARAGDAGAFSELLAAHRKHVYRFILKLSGDPDAAWDVVQVACEAAFRKLAQFRAEARFRSWLISIAHNMWCMELRRARARRTTAVGLHLHERDEPFTEDSPEVILLGLLDDVCRRAALTGALARTRPEEAAAIVAHHLDGRAQVDIAAEQDISIPCLKSRLHRGRQKMAQHLRKMGYA